MAFLNFASDQGMSDETIALLAPCICLPHLTKLDLSGMVRARVFISCYIFVVLFFVACMADMQLSKAIKFFPWAWFNLIQDC